MTATLATVPASQPVSPASAPFQRVWHYPAHPRSVGAARRDVAAQLRLWKLDEVIEPAALVVSELATNAVLASPSAPENDGHSSPTPGIALRLTYSHQDTILEMWDEATDHPIQRTGEANAEHGRGLQLVAALARDWGCYRVRSGDVTRGKVVWAALRHDRPSITVLRDPRRPPLPKRSPSPPSRKGASDQAIHDRALLQRVIDRLRALDDWTPQPTSARTDL